MRPHYPTHIEVLLMATTRRSRRGKGGNTVIDRDMGWKQIREDLRTLSTADVQVGWFDEVSPPHHSDDGSTLPMATLGAIHEFGTRTIPARPAIRGATDKHADDIGKEFATVYTGIVDSRGVGARGVQKRVSDIGRQFVLWTRKYIRADGPTVFQKLKPETVARKGSSKPLIDTRQLIRNITFAVLIRGKKKVHRPR